MMAALWYPDESLKRESQLIRFQKKVSDKTGTTFSSYQDFYQWSVEENILFWSLFWDFASLVNAQKGEKIFQKDISFEKSRFFPEGRLNYAENLLQGADDQEAIIFRGEDLVKKRLTYRELRSQVHHLQSAFKEMGVRSGDRVVAFIPNIPEAIVAMLAATSLGAVWSSCSPDFGLEGLLDRFGQIQPKILLTADGYFYKGQSHNSLEKIAQALPSLPSVEKVIVIPYISPSPQLSHMRDSLLYNDFLKSPPIHPLTFESLPFDHPLFILFSSGTTGKPKCIIHGHGGTLIQHLKEHRLHCDLKPGSRLFYYTTTGWMMWNWLVSGLASQSTVMLYDGSPFHNGPDILWNFAEQEGCTHFGTSAKYIDALHKAGFSTQSRYPLLPLRMILSTGSPLIPKSFDYIYKEIAPHACLSSISGGTDILSCFALGNITEPVFRGELQTRGLGMAVEVFDDEGCCVHQTKGELVCTMPFPSMPVGFWDDLSGEKYHSAYFERFQGVWHHGDFVELTKNNGLIIYGRSDSVLNPGGVRIGTAEIYRQVDPLEEIQESLVIGQQWAEDIRVILFVKLMPGYDLDEILISKIRQRIEEKATPRHVPAKIIKVKAIPRTISGKIVELAVSDVVHGRPVKNTEALANPEALEFFKDIPELQE